MNDLHAVINQGRDDTADHPAARQRPDDQQDDQSCRDTGDIVDHRQLQRLPAYFAVGHGDQAADGCGGKQHDLAAAAEGITAECAYCHKQEGYQNKYGNQGK